MRSNAAIPAREARFRNSRDMIVGQDGNVNAGSTKELAQRFVEIAQMIQAGEIVTDSGETRTPREVASDNAQVLREAYADKTGNRWAELGAAISNDIDDRLEREGFMRSILNRGDLQDGAIPRMRVRERNVHAIVSRGPVQVYPQYLRNSYVTMDEFYITATPRVEEIELRQGAGDVLEEKYFEGLEAIMVVEDQTLLKMLRNADGIYNDLTYFSGAFTQSTLQAVKQKIEEWRLPALTAIMSIDLLSDMTTGSDYSTWFDPISKWEIVQTGRIGRVLGLDIITDGYRQQNLQVLEKGEFMILGSPEFLGGYTDRGPIESRAVDEFDKLVPARGWSMFEIVSMAVANSKAVARGKRI